MIKELEKINIYLGSDTKALLVAGDKVTILGLLKNMHTISQNRNPVLSTQRFTADGALLLDKIDPNINYTDTETTLEFLIVSLCKNFDITPKQAAGLLTQNGKILSQVISRGLKGKFEPVYN